MKSKNILIVVYGLPGSGKSYFALKLHDVFTSEYLSSDKVRLKIFEKRSYSEEERDLVYVQLQDQAKEFLSRGKNVIVDATFTKEIWRRTFESMATDCGVITKFIFIEAEESVVRERLSRKRELSEANYDVYKMLKETFEEDEQEQLVLNSGKLSIDEMISKSLNFLGIH